MEKWRSKSKTVPKTDSLLPPTRRQTDVEPCSVEKRKGKRWTIGGFFKKISNRESDLSSSEDASSIHTPVLRRKKTKNILKSKPARRAIRSSLQTKKDLDFEYTRGKPSDPNPFIFSPLESTPLYHESMYSRSSEGSLDGSNKKFRKDKMKARVEAKRDKLCINSSTDESASESRPQNGMKNDVCLRRRRTARAERFIKRLCKDENGSLKPITSSQDFDQISDANSRFSQDKWSDKNSQIFSSPNTLPKYHSRSPPAIDYQLEIQEAENPLVRQTLQYFSDFDKSVNFNENKANNLREKKKLDSRRRQTQQIFPVTTNFDVVPDKKSRSQEDIYQDHLPVFEAKVSQQVRKSYVSPYEYSKIDHKENARFSNWRPDNQFYLPKEEGIYSRIRSPTQRSEIVFKSELKTPSRLSPAERNLEERSLREKELEKRSSKNLEEALCELEAIYNSLQLGDEDLLERAEKRSMEEYSNKKIEHILSDLERNMNYANTKAKPSEAEPNIIKDDMAYRRLKSSSRPTSDGHAILSNISYLITSPLAARRDSYIDSKPKVRRREPDVTLDDVVFRNLHHANNTLKVLEPQPPFGIPLGPITGATESDYLHRKPSKSERRSIYLPRCEPDIVTDDLAFRNLRKDALDKSVTDEKQNWERPSAFVAKKKRAVRSLSANLYSLINREVGVDETELDSESTNGIEGRVSDDSLDINGNKPVLELKIEQDQTVSKDVGPFTEQEISVYRKLCQELENLVDSTKSFEPESIATDSRPNPVEERIGQGRLEKLEFGGENPAENDIDEIGNEITSLREKLTNFVASNEDRAVSTKEIEDKIISKNVEKTREEFSLAPVINRADESNFVEGVSDKAVGSREGCDSQDALVSEGADTTLT
ncbi:uncharacterized protein LOC117177904 isoform X2 [Belonocnema kinseyi]|uniref:uncharacterized protein LOC117177904 isoform X2 n=1 Tax=Belonocnema kinseyi TaxID=2817044 RepID=UPI00143D021A|nr:uncharacterized protein LOC117177904 isoform X2 [Belonocnema kinseyi]